MIANINEYLKQRLRRLKWADFGRLDILRNKKIAVPVRSRVMDQYIFLILIYEVQDEY